MEPWKWKAAIILTIWASLGAIHLTQYRANIFLAMVGFWAVFLWQAHRVALLRSTGGGEYMSDTPPAEPEEGTTADPEEEDEEENKEGE